jgi:hypothetical protein
VSTDHHERLKGVVKTALKEAAMGEPFGFVVSTPGIWPVKDDQGQDVGAAPGWFIVVTIRGAGLGEPDIGNGFPVYGVLPNDDDFRNVARRLLERCRQERDSINVKALQAVGPSMKLSERPK